MRNTRARALSAGWAIAGLAVTLALSACSGLDVISLGGTPSTSGDRFLSPTGNDQNDGSMDRPWKTFKHALKQLVPGWTLKLLGGTYEDGTTGTLNVKCDASASGTVPDATLAMNGLLSMPITVQAFGERVAFVRGNGHVPPLSIDSCHDWSIVGLRVESQDVADNLTTPDSGSVVVLDGANNNVTLDRLLASHPNTNQPSDVIRIGDGSSGVTVEECELYDFQHNGIEAWRSSALVFQRNYINSRAPAGSKPHGPADYGLLLEETKDAVVANNIVEGVGVGFGVVGRSMNVTAPIGPDPVDNNRLLGNIVNEPTSIGFRLDGQCQGLTPCDPVHTVKRTALVNDVVIGGAIGVSDAGSVATTIDAFSVIGAARGVALIRELQNKGVQATSATSNLLVTKFQSVAFEAGDESDWKCDHCAALGGYPTAAIFRPDDGRITKVNVMTDLGPCLVSLPAGNPLQTAGVAGAAVGANVLHRYDDTGAPLTDPLWDATGAFLSCGATVDYDKDGGTSCTSVGMRLNVGFTHGCPFP